MHIERDALFNLLLKTETNFIFSWSGQRDGGHGDKEQMSILFCQYDELFVIKLN